MSNYICSKQVPFGINILKHKDVLDVVNEIKRRDVNFSAVMRQLLREYRDRGYMTEAEWKEAVERGEVELDPHIV